MLSRVCTKPQAALRTFGCANPKLSKSSIHGHDSLGCKADHKAGFEEKVRSSVDKLDVVPSDA